MRKYGPLCTSTSMPEGQQQTSPPPNESSSVHSTAQGAPNTASGYKGAQPSNLGDAIKASWPHGRVAICPSWTRARLAVRTMTTDTARMRNWDEKHMARASDRALGETTVAGTRLRDTGCDFRLRNRALANVAVCPTGALSVCPRIQRLATELRVIPKWAPV